MGVSEKLSARIFLMVILLLIMPTFVDSQSLMSSEEVWRKWAADPRANVQEIPEQNYCQVYDHLFWFINKTKSKDVVFVDVGCAVGDYVEVVEARSSKKVISFGIDPIDWPGRRPYTKFIQTAVAKVDGTEVIFNLYGSSDLGSSSLQKLIADNVTHDPSKASEKFYHPAQIEGFKGTQRTTTIRLDTLLKEQKISRFVDILKVDTQGSDLEVVSSAGDLLSHILFVQTESLMTENDQQKLYEGQSLFRQDREFFSSKGFEVFNIARFPAGPEADVVFVNVKLFRRLATEAGIPLAPQ
jgi:23S rRNA U2552 (ribose-2'-O)-methylase RlmE/FtsJ